MTFYVFEKNKENEPFYFNNTEMKNSDAEKILGITIGQELKFESHVKIYVRKFLKRSGLCYIY